MPEANHAIPVRRSRGPVDRLRPIMALAVLVLAVAACGNRLSHQEIVAAAGAGGGSTAVGPNGVASSTGPGAIQSGVPVPGSTLSGGTIFGSIPGVAPSGGSTGTKSTIIIGSVGTYSGIPGGVMLPGLHSLQAWVAATNAKGGIEGHPIKLLVADDQTDPTRHKAALQDMVERQHVIAFVGLMAPLTDRAGKDYLESKRVPAIGGANTTGVWFESPMYFPTLPTSATIVVGMLRTAVRFSGGTKLATITCVEGAACSDFKNLSKQLAPQAGVQVVYQADVSLAQPDFTNECLGAQGNGAQIVWPVGDQNLVHRVAQSCARQGFRPQYVQATPSENETGFTLLDGQVLAGGSFPFVGVKGTFTDEYTRAMDRYFPQQELATLSPSGWSMGKIFERAVTIALQHTDNPTSSDILQALWTFRGETLGGLNVPLTYTKNKPGIVGRCWFTSRMKDGRWLTPDGVKPSCWT